VTSLDAAQWLSAHEATERLKVKPDTLYAYVSRGLLRSERVPGSRTARYLRADVERLARRSRGNTPRTGPEIVIDSAVTLLDPAGHLYYRGQDATALASVGTYEETARLLWGIPPDSVLAWSPLPSALKAARAAQRHLPQHATPPDRLRVIAAVIAPYDALRNDRHPGSVALRAANIIATLVAALPVVDGADPPGAHSSIAARLWPRLTDRPATKTRLEALDHALILLADHELAASTYAARVAASTWADPYLLILTGLSVASGPLHAGASEQVRALLREVVLNRSAEASIAERLRNHEHIPGFGHSVYQGPDPRAAALLEAIARTNPPRALQRAVTHTLDLVEAGNGPEPNVDFALGLLAESNAMVTGAGEAIFVLARCAGWIAHGIEEYPHRFRYRARAAYTGPTP
jgi:citrate synthase